MEPPPLKLFLGSIVEMIFREDFFMSEKMLVTQALDERDLLVKKISDKIAKASFVDTIKPNEDKVYAKRIDKAEYAKEAEASYQQINDLIERFQKIDAAIVDSNAKTEVKTSYGTFTVAGAISLRSRLRGMDSYDGEADFEGRLRDKLNSEYNERVRFCDMKNSQLQNTAESMRLSILGRDSKIKDDKPLGVVDAYVKENTTELVDPLDVKKKLELLEEKRNILLKRVAAACTNRRPLPNELPKEPFNVFYQSAEDGIGDTIKPRLRACGADLERVRVINEEEQPLSMTDPRLEQAIIQNDVKLVIMDPIQAYVGANVDMNRANEIRPLFRYLHGIAERTGAAIVLIGHLNKNAGAQATYRGLGSVDISAAVRSILHVGKVHKEESKDIRVVIQTKSSLAPKPTPVAYTLEHGFVEWIGEYEITVEELMTGKTGKQQESKMDQGVKLIRELLDQRKSMYVADLDASGTKHKISERTMRTARKMIESELEYGYENNKKTVHLK